MKVYSDVARWSRPGQGFVTIRWVCLRKDDGFRAFLFSTDPSMTPEQIVETYSLRWNIEVTFQLCREHLGLESPRQRAAKSVERMTPCLFGLFTVVALVYAASVAGRTVPKKLARSRPWYTKTEPTFSDALAHVRGLFLRALFIAPRSGAHTATSPPWPDATALLLPDGRVLAAGHDAYLNAPPFDHSRYQLEAFSPPYLFRGPRPLISAAPGQTSYGSTIEIRTSDAADIQSVALIRQGSVTHTINTDQRYVGLAILPPRQSDRLTVQAPPDANIAPPGYYMLFIVNGRGVPSVAAWIRITR